MTKSMMISITNKTRLYKKRTNKPNYNNKILYWQYKNKLTSIIRHADNSYYNNLLLQARHSTRDLLKIYAELNNKGKRNTTNVKKLVNYIDVNGNESIAKAMNQYFATVDKEMSKSCNHSKEHEQFLIHIYHTAC